MSNPFQLVWDALWELAEANTALTALVYRGNRIKFDDRHIPKRSIGDGDLPELLLLSTGGEINMKNSSSTTKVTRNYTWAIATGEFDINEFYNDVSWELLCAMIDWDVTICALEWPASSNWHFAVKCDMTTVEEGTFMAEENRGIVGWAGMWKMEIEMHLRTSDLRPITGTGSGT